MPRLWQKNPKKMNELQQFEIIEHTADIGMKAFGRTRKELFCNAAYGMCSIIAKKKKDAEKSKSKYYKIELSSANQEELLVNWLSELLSLIDIYSIIFTQIEITKLSHTKIQAKATAEKITAAKYELNLEIKAVTYHELKIEKSKNYLQAQVFFDI